MIQRRTFLAAAAAVIVSPLALLRKAKAVEKVYGPIQLGKEKSIPFPSRGCVRRNAYAPGSGDKLYFLGENRITELSDDDIAELVMHDRKEHWKAVSDDIKTGRLDLAIG